MLQVSTVETWAHKSRLSASGTHVCVCVNASVCMSLLTLELHRRFATVREWDVMVYEVVCFRSQQLRPGHTSLVRQRVGRMCVCVCVCECKRVYESHNSTILQAIRHSTRVGHMVCKQVSPCMSGTRNCMCVHASVRMSLIRIEFHRRFATVREWDA